MNLTLSQNIVTGILIGTLLMLPICSTLFLCTSSAEAQSQSPLPQLCHSNSCNPEQRPDKSNDTHSESIPISETESEDCSQCFCELKLDPFEQPLITFNLHSLCEQLKHKLNECDLAIDSPPPRLSFSHI
tara:strand:- start:122 stop:511 length:390 start_codon:yes stop_codon:yes gene_type:complete